MIPLPPSPLRDRIQAAVTRKDAARGRVLTDAEKVGNLRRWMEGEAG